MKDRTHTILVVDDDPDIQSTLQLILEKHGYRVVIADSAESGLRAYKESAPDFIIVDLMMEEIDSGTSLVKELKALGNAAPIFLLSSVGDNLHATTDYAELGLSGILQKPLDAQTILSVLGARLGS